MKNFEYRVIKFVYQPDDELLPEYTIAKVNTQNCEIIFDFELLAEEKQELYLLIEEMKNAFLKPEIEHLVKTY